MVAKRHKDDVAVHQPALTNGKFEAYCHAYVRGLNGTKAAIEAGYAEGSAHVTSSRLLARTDIKRRIHTLREMHGLNPRKPATFSRQWVLDSLVRNVENALAASDRTAANRGLELLGREFNLFTEKKVEMTTALDGLTADQLMSLLSAAAALEASETGPTIDLEAVSLPDEHSDASEISGLQDDVPEDVPDEADPGLEEGDEAAIDAEIAAAGAAGAPPADGPPAPLEAGGGVEREGAGQQTPPTPVS